MGDNPYDVIQWQQGITLDLCVDVLPLSAGRQQLHQRDVIPAGGRTQLQLQTDFVMIRFCLNTATLTHTDIQFKSLVNKCINICRWFQALVMWAAPADTELSDGMSVVTKYIYSNKSTNSNFTARVHIVFVSVCAVTVWSTLLLCGSLSVCS